MSRRFKFTPKRTGRLTRRLSYLIETHLGEPGSILKEYQIIDIIGPDNLGLATQLDVLSEEGDELEDDLEVGGDEDLDLEVDDEDVDLDLEVDDEEVEGAHHCVCPKCGYEGLMEPSEEDLDLDDDLDLEDEEEVDLDLEIGDDDLEDEELEVSGEGYY